MKKKFQTLVSDTLLFARQNEWIVEKKSTEPPPVSALPKHILKEKVEAKTPPPKKEEPTPKNPPQKHVPPLLFDTIRKHLPHIQLIDTFPEIQSVAILVKDESDLPFFKNLAKAIEQRFCPVTLLKQENNNHLDRFFLILTQDIIAHLPEGKQILLAKREVYENNTSEKKLLWSQICKRLSPKSS